MAEYKLCEYRDDKLYCIDQVNCKTCEIYKEQENVGDSISTEILADSDSSS